MKIFLDTLGCKLNQAETDLMARELSRSGHCIVSGIDDADIYILNTCTVTGTADSKSRRRLRQAYRRNPNALIVATGCYAQRARGEMTGIEGVKLVCDNAEKAQLPGLIEGLQGFPASSSLSKEAPIPSYIPRTRIFIKVQDGCDTPCSYCIVPLVRGRETSMPAETIISEIKDRVEDGYQEAVLTGTKIGTYQHKGADLTRLLQRILAETGITRLRLSSLQPQEISTGLLGLWADERLCPHFHLSLQSGSDPVLARMKRKYRAAEYEQAVSLIQTNVPDAAITTDIIVGFPGETEDEFSESYRFCEQMGFARIHVFPYSRRSGTAASRMPGQIDSRTKKERVDAMLALAEESASSFRQRFSGKEATVLWEQLTPDGLWSGVTGNYIRVLKKSDEDLSNRLTSVKLT